MNALAALLEFSGRMLAALPAALALLSAVALRPRQAGDPDGDEGEDAALVAAAREGDGTALNRLIRKYQPRVYAFCMHLLHDADEAEELTQEVFIKVCANLRRFRGDAKFSTWLFQIAKNLSLNRIKYLRRRRRHSHTSLDEPRPGEDEGGLDLPADGKDAAAQAEDRELGALLREKIAALSEEVRRPFVMRADGMRYDEIAREMKVAEGTVKSRIHRARSELKRALENYLEPGSPEP